MMAKEKSETSLTWLHDHELDEKRHMISWDEHDKHDARNLHRFQHQLTMTTTTRTTTTTTLLCRRKTEQEGDITISICNTQTRNNEPQHVLRHTISNKLETHALEPDNVLTQETHDFMQSYDYDFVFGRRNRACSRWDFTNTSRRLTISGANTRLWWHKRFTISLLTNKTHDLDDSQQGKEKRRTQNFREPRWPRLRN